MTRDNPAYTFSMQVDYGKYLEFATATGFKPKPEKDKPVVPPTFLATAEAWLSAGTWPAGEILGFDLKRSLHGEQEFIFYKPVRVGDRLTGRIWLESTFSKTGSRGGEMRFSIWVTGFDDESGNLVAQSKMTIVETGSEK